MGLLGVGSALRNTALLLPGLLLKKRPCSLRSLGASMMMPAAERSSASDVHGCSQGESHLLVPDAKVQAQAARWGQIQTRTRRVVLIAPFACLAVAIVFAVRAGPLVPWFGWTTLVALGVMVVAQMWLTFRARRR
jgi:hypothetical protein